MVFLEGFAGRAHVYIFKKTFSLRIYCGQGWGNVEGKRKSKDGTVAVCIA